MISFGYEPLEGQMDYYAVLGIARDAEDIVITAAYKAMVKKYHPDAVSYTHLTLPTNREV